MYRLERSAPQKGVSTGEMYDLRVLLAWREEQGAPSTCENIAAAVSASGHGRTFLAHPLCPANDGFPSLAGHLAL